MTANWSDLFHLLNPNSVRRTDVSSFFAGSPWERVWIERKTHPTHLETAVHWAVNEGRSGIAVWGGDGTLSRVINALDDLGALETMPIALVPAGTCNDFARQLKLGPWRKLLTRGALVEKKMDLATLVHAEGRRLFINNAGFGRRPQARQDRRPSAIADIFRLSAEPVEVIARGDGAERHERMKALMAIVFNAPYFGGGMHFPGDIRPDDGLLDGYFVQEQGRLKVLWSFFRGRAGRPFENARTVPFRAPTILVRSGGELFPQADGESASKGAVKELTFSVLPKALRLLVPDGPAENKG